MNSMIRHAVGAIIIQDQQVLLAHKVKMMAGKNGPEPIEGMWDFPKGGVNQSDVDLQSALLRELREETGSSAYIILKAFDETLDFSFDAYTQEKIGYQSQQTHMFLVEYTGNGSDLAPADEEIDQLEWFPYKQVLNVLTHPEPRDFYRKANISL